MLLLLFFLLFFTVTAQKNTTACNKDSGYAAAVKLAVMATGNFDHCVFGLPQWAANKWRSHIKKDKTNNRYRKRKAVIKIKCAENTGAATPVYFWLIEKYEPALNKKWLIYQAEIIWR